MPLALVTIGLIMIVTGARDTHHCFALDIKDELTGAPRENFIWWIAALGAIGAVGYIPAMRPFSRWFLALTIIVLVLAQQKQTGGGFFGELERALAAGPTPPSTSCGTPASGTTAETPADKLAVHIRPYSEAATGVLTRDPVTVMGDISQGNMERGAQAATTLAKIFGSM